MKPVNLTCAPPLRYPFNGFGVQWDVSPHTERDFELLCRRAVLCGVKKIRMFFHNGLCKKNADSECRFDDPVFSQTFRLLDFCERENIRVCAVFCDCVSFDKDGQKIPDKCEAEPYVETVLACVCELLETRNYTCVTELTCFHEPDVDIDHYRYKHETYYAVCKKVAEGLSRMGLRERVKLNLSDNRCCAGMQEFIRKLGTVGDLYNNHNYLNSSDDSNEFLTFITKMGVHAASRFDRPFVIGEFGWDDGLTELGVGMMSPWGQTGVDTYARGLFLARYAIQALNTGAVGVSYRSFCDTEYGARKWTAGLFCDKDGAWACRPQYYAWGLMMNYADPGAAVYPVKTDCEEVIAAVLQNPDGSTTIFAANSGQQDAPFRLSLPEERDLQFRAFFYREGRLPAGEELLSACAEASAERGILQGTIPANSLSVYTTKDKSAEKPKKQTN